jgi:hypothetical protein
MLAENFFLFLVIDTNEILMVGQLGISQIIWAQKHFKSGLYGFLNLNQYTDFFSIVFYFEKFLNRLVAHVRPRVEPEERDEFHVETVDLEFELSPQGQVLILKLLDSIWVVNQRVDDVKAQPNVFVLVALNGKPIPQQ